MAAEESVKNKSGNYISSFMSFLQGDKPNTSVTEKSGDSKGSKTTEESAESLKNGKLDVITTDNQTSENMEEDMQTNDSDAPLTSSPDDGSKKNNENSNASNGTKQPESSENSAATSPKEESSSTGGAVDETKDSDFTYNSDNESRSSASGGIRNVARRGRKRKQAEYAPHRETPRRAARKVKCYVEDEAFNEIEGPDDPDYNFSDSDDDPDFDPSKKKSISGSPELELKPRRSRTTKGRGKGRVSLNRSFRKSVENENVDESSNSTKLTEAEPEPDHDSSNNSNSTQKRRGRPPTYASDTVTEISDNTVSSTNDTKTSGKLSSAYNYASARTRQNQAIRLPEGPNLTDEQLKIIESQFKSGDFVMAKKDTDMMENPPIWRIDGKSLLQKFQAFEKDGKMLYRNISTYSGWTSQAKALYVPVKVKFVFQSRYDTVVELVGFTGEDGVEQNTAAVVDKPVWQTKSKEVEITEELRQHMPSFEIYLQTLISQALDNNFLQEIYEENDAYFVEKVKTIDDLTDDRKGKILELSKWAETFQRSLDTWPCVNTMAGTKNAAQCEACGSKDVTMLSQFYGQPYDQKTLRSKEPTAWDLEHKNFDTCDSCSSLSQLYNKVAHQKYEYYSQCKSTVTNIRVSTPNKTTTTILRDLLANDEWISNLFRTMCTTWIKVDNMHREHFTRKTVTEDSDTKTIVPDKDGNDADPSTILVDGPSIADASSSLSDGGTSVPEVKATT